ncbi:MAG TPA: glycoside hydrolase family 15 protein [Gaiellaceae bacterium]|jgi:GH15 family glucan-1,4-alpha-glucosidase|nr:glycoside hydrolase family 15 protein [Gaiellaceae bacterium]
MRLIEDYALVGDLHTAALVGRDGSIDWCCLPRFDSDACLAAILGTAEHGRWQLGPTAKVRRRSRGYRPETLVLESTVVTGSGSVRVIDFMPPRRERPHIVRLVEGLSGRVAMRSELLVRPDFGRIVPWVREVDEHTVTAIAGPDAVGLRSTVRLERTDGTAIASNFTVTEGDRVPFVLAWFPSHEDPPAEIDPWAALEETEAYWCEWASRCTHHGIYRDEVIHSLIVLKALTYAPTGGIAAAATTSLPEQIGGSRNWDYRFCWLRDATQTLLAMLDSGYQEEATVWRHWLLRAVAGDPTDVQIMYGLAGERRLDERELEWLPGFEGSRPVRVGNAASTQLQLDTYGELVDALYETEIAGAPSDDAVWELVKRFLSWLEEGWRQKDAGIWEVRGELRHFTHSKVMAWVAFDRGVRFCEECGHSGDVERWRQIRDEIHAEVLQHGFSEAKQSFTQAFDSEELDASLLQMPLVGFLPATDPRVVSTVAAIRRELEVGGLLLRYRTDPGLESDGLPAGEGVFLACSFWLVSVLALQGQIFDAHELFNNLLDLRSDIGLLAEEYDPAEGRQLGNFPQALTHLALVDAALILDRQTERFNP